MNILLLAFEGESIPIGYLARLYKEKGHRVLVINVDHWNIKYTKGEIFGFYRQACGLEESEFAHLRFFYEQINKADDSLKHEDIDWALLRSFEQDYLPNDVTLSRIFATDTLFYRVFHHRDIYYIPDNKLILYKAVEILIRQVKDWLRFEPQLIFSIQNQYAIKFLFYSISRKQNIPYFDLFVSRIQSQWILSSSFHVDTCPFIRKAVEQRHLDRANTSAARTYVELLNTKLKASYASHESILKSMSKDYQGLLRIRKSWNVLFFFLKLYLKGRVTSYRGWFQRDYFEPSLLAIARLEVRGILRMLEYRRTPLLNRKTLPPSPFIYFTMHLMPESSTSTMADTLNELECIYQLSLIMPADWKIVVKINPSMIADVDNHPNSYYKRIAMIPSVWFVSPEFPSLEIIRQCKATASLAGTSLFEGVLMGKPGICWGRPEFAMMPGIIRFEEGRVMYKLTRPFDQELALHYVQYCLDEGLELDLNALMAGTDVINEDWFIGLMSRLHNKLEEKTSEYYSKNRVS